MHRKGRERVRYGSGGDGTEREGTERDMFGNLVGRYLALSSCLGCKKGKNSELQILLGLSTVPNTLLAQQMTRQWVSKQDVSDDVSI